jgi:aspartyl-tRNA(Asn)/glutamyl-tRNA(Gln) amidotransferase subunit A
LTDDFAHMTIRELGRQIRQREASVVEVVRAAIERTEWIDSKLNSYITVAAEQALDTAARADKEIRQGLYRGPLHGILISVKDHIDTAGIRTTAGAKVLQNRVPQSDAIVVRKLKDAGAILIGKANMDRFAGGESGWIPD